MKFSDTITFVLLTISVVLCYTDNLFASSTVEWSILETLKLEEAAIDVAVSPDGRRIFVLSEQGNVFIYTSGSRASTNLDVGKHVDQIKVGPMGNTLILNSRKNMSLQVIALDFIQYINVLGSPFKGREDAPIVVAVFSDFE
jgi:hypothetical protein